MPEAARAYRHTVWYLQHKNSHLQALTRLAADTKTAYEAAATGGTPDIALLERARASLEVALREGRAMANLDDAAVARREPAA